MLDPTIANPATFKLGNPLEDSQNALNTVLLMEKVTDGRIKRRKGEARNALMKMPGVMKDDGTIDRPTLRRAAVSGGYGEFIPDWEEQWAKDDENLAQVEQIKANTTKSQYEASKVQADDVAKRLETTAQFLGLAQTPQDVANFITQDPVLGKHLASRGMGPEQLNAALSRMNPQQFEQFRMSLAAGAKEALKNHYIEVDKGGTGGIYRMPEYGSGAPTQVANWTVTKDPNHNPPQPHWVQDYNPSTGTVTHKPVTGPTTVTPVKVPQTPEEKAMLKELADRAKAAAAIVPELNKMGGGQFIVHPETGDIEIKGGMPLSPVAQRRLDMLAGEYGARIEMVPGQNPRIVLNEGTTLGTVQSIQRAKNALVWEQAGNGVERLTPKVAGVERRPVEARINPKVSPVKLKAQALSMAQKWGAANFKTQEEILDYADTLYQELLNTPGAGFDPGTGDPAVRLMNEMKADREARQGGK